MSGRQDRNRRFGWDAYLRGPVNHNRMVSVDKSLRQVSRNFRDMEKAVRRLAKGFSAFAAAFRIGGNS